MTDDRQEYIAKTEEDLKMLNARLTVLEAKADQKTGDARRQLRDTLSRIRESKNQAEERLNELRGASKPAWEDVKQGVEEAWNSLSDAVDSAAQRFK